MEERRFIIAELVGLEEDGKPLFVGKGIGISELELLHRLSLCVTSKDRIVTLLHGENKETPKHAGWKFSTSPITTRKNWEEWAQKVASFLTDRPLQDYYRHEIKDLFLEMPGIPKE